MPGCHVKPEQMFNLIFGYSDWLAELKSGPGTGAAVVVASSVVPSDEAWVFTHVASRHSNAAVLACSLGVRYSGGNIELIQNLALAQWVYLERDVYWIVGPGGNAFAQFQALPLGQTGYFSYSLFKMKLAQ